MFVIRLASGNLLVPEYAVGDDDRLLGDAYVEIGPDHADYARLAAARDHRAGRPQHGASAGRTATSHFVVSSLTTSRATAPTGGWNDGAASVTGRSRPVTHRRGQATPAKRQPAARPASR